MEGDSGTAGAGAGKYFISIHSLRMEGDNAARTQKGA